MKIQKTENWLKGRSPCFADPKRQINPPLVLSIGMQLLLFFFPGAYLPSMHFFKFRQYKNIPCTNSRLPGQQEVGEEKQTEPMSQSLSTGQRGLEQRAKSWLPMTTVTSQPPQRASVLSLESSREVPAAWREWLCFSDTMEFLLSQFYWEIIYTHQCMNLRQTAWWFGLNIPWSDCHNRFSQHPSSCMDPIKRKEKQEKHFLLVMRILRLYLFLFVIL